MTNQFEKENKLLTFLPLVLPNDGLNSSVLILPALLPEIVIRFLIKPKSANHN